MANSFTSQQDPLGQTVERLWFQNPIQALSPEIIRPFSWSQVPSRLPLYYEEDELPQQTAGASGVTMDFGSSYNVSTNINNSYNFDVQQNSTSFVFNYNNTNNTTEVSYTEGDIINNAGDNITNTINATGTSGYTGTIVSYSNSVWNEPNMVLDFDVQTATYTNGLLVSVTTTVHNVTLDALSELWNWYDDADSFSIVEQVADVNITGNNLVEERYDWTFVHGLLQNTPVFHDTHTISPLTNCPP